MVRTRVGYAGGRKQNPTYGDLGDHTETVQVDYDPAVITYEQLLAAFWTGPGGCASGDCRQYMSAIFYHNDVQKKLALESRDRQAARQESSGATEVLPLGAFWLAEDYHQKYLLRQHADLMRELQADYPDPASFRDSTAAARLNSFLGGNGSREQLAKELDRLGLSGEAVRALLRRDGGR